MVIDKVLLYILHYITEETGMVYMIQGYYGYDQKTWFHEHALKKYNFTLI